jgi:hypothetical protein
VVGGRDERERGAADPARGGDGQDGLGGLGHAPSESHGVRLAIVRAHVLVAGERR